MQCPCGAEAKSHDVIRQSQIVMFYHECTACGRNNYANQLAIFFPNGLPKIKRKKKSGA